MNQSTLHINRQLPLLTAKELRALNELKKNRTLSRTVVRAMDANNAGFNTATMAGLVRKGYARTIQGDCAWELTEAGAKS